MKKHKKHQKKTIGRWLSAFGIGIILLFVFSMFLKPAVAQSMISQIRDVLVTKAGFTFLNDATSDFLYYKKTENYTAYAGDKTTGGGHRMRLTVDNYIVDFSLIAVSSVALESGAPIASSSSSTYAGVDETEQTLNRIKALMRSIDKRTEQIDTMADDVKEERGTTAKAQLTERPQERIVLFENVRQGIDMLYRLNVGGIKEEIVLRDPDLRHSQYIFSLDTHGLSVKDVGNGVWYFYDIHGTPVFRIPKGWAKDATGAFTNDVRVTIKGTLIFVTVDETWINAKERVFPITIDPTIEVIPEKRQTGSSGNKLHSNTSTFNKEATKSATPPANLNTLGTSSISAVVSVSLASSSAGPTSEVVPERKIQ